MLNGMVIKSWSPRSWHLGWDLRDKEKAVMMGGSEGNNAAVREQSSEVGKDLASRTRKRANGTSAEGSRQSILCGLQTRSVVSDFLCRAVGCGQLQKFPGGYSKPTDWALLPASPPQRAEDVEMGWYQDHAPNGFTWRKRGHNSLQKALIRIAQFSWRTHQERAKWPSKFTHQCLGSVPLLFKDRNTCEKATTVLRVRTEGSPLRVSLVMPLWTLDPEFMNAGSWGNDLRAFKRYVAIYI